MNYEKMNTLLSAHMTEEGFKFWLAINKKIISPWEKPASSGGKYHNKKGGYVPSIAEHTYEMLYAASKNYAQFGINKSTKDADLLLLAIGLHDGLKYGPENEKKHTVSDHDTLMANRVESARESFKKIFSDEQIDILVQAIRFHTGKWSHEATKDFSFKDLHPYVLYVHSLDMLSSRNCLKTED